MRLVPSLVVALLIPGVVSAQTGRLPVFDAHLHARDGVVTERILCIPVTLYGVVGPKCDHPLRAPLTDSGMVAATVAELERLNVYGVISGHPLERVQRFVRKAPDRLRPGYQFSLGYDRYLTVEELRARLESGDYEVIGEIELQYDGISPAAARMDPYWELAEELDVPVAVHLGEGYPGVPYDGDGYRVSLGHPFELEGVLVRHPALRLYVMHYGSPLVDEMIGILYAHPNVYIDVGGNLWPYPREYVVIEEAPFLSEAEKRDILYNNAARFFRLSEEEISRHHRRRGRPNN